MTDLENTLVGLVALQGGGFLLKEVVIPMLKKKTESNDDKLNILWDSHNSKKNDSDNLKALQEEFNTHKQNFGIFSTRYEYNFEEINKRFAEVIKLIEHKENSNKQQQNSIYSVLERIEDKVNELKK